MVRTLVALALVAVAGAQDTTPCESYDLTTGKGVCDGVAVDVGGVICAGGFNRGACKASQTLPDGRTEVYYFRGAPTGLPAATSIQSDCSTTEFPSSGGVAMAQTYVDASGNPAGCYPAADVQGTTLTYSAGTAAGTLASVTVNFNVHTDAGGTQRDGFIRITCVTGGRTSNYQYTTVGDQGHESQYEIDSTADCSAAGGGASPSGAPATGGGSTGWILIGVCLGGMAVYFASGYVYNWKVKGAESGDRIPNKEFWVSLPDLVKTGFRFTLSKVKREPYQPL